MERKLTFLPILIIALLISFLSGTTAPGQSIDTNKYGLPVINRLHDFKESINADSNKRMVNIGNCLPGIVLDLRYSTANNFMGRELYPPINTSYLRKPAADSLAKVLQDLQNQNLTLKIFDAYRPYSVTEKVWESVKDDRYAADPAKGSGHNRGIAVDLTLVFQDTGQELEMGTGFDNFSDTAHTDFTQLPEEILKNRQRLKSVMERHGFVSLDTEWWHFSLPNANSFELMDLGFDELKKIGLKCR